jgi:hypothetical protein
LELAVAVGVEEAAGVDELAAGVAALDPLSELAVVAFELSALLGFGLE